LRINDFPIKEPENRFPIENQTVFRKIFLEPVRHSDPSTSAEVKETIKAALEAANGGSWKYPAA
jgi:hypothetical protein